MNDINSDNQNNRCFYCVEYNKIYSDYPINNAVFNEFNDMTPRCNMHWQYQCNSCKKYIHFNGVAFCNDCNYFTCVKCGEDTLQMEEFFFYNYYYNIKCMNCTKITGSSF